MKNIGLIGCGNIAETYFRAQEYFNNINFVACADINLDAAKKTAEQYNIIPLSVDEILNDKNVDIILNLTIPQAHYEISKRALEANKHVYCEKPMSVKFDDAKDLLNLAGKKSLYIGNAPDTFLGGGLQKSRELLDKKVIGKVKFGNAIFAYPGLQSYHPNPEPWFSKKGGGFIQRHQYKQTLLLVNQVFGQVDILDKLSLIGGASYSQVPILEISPILTCRFTSFPLDLHVRSIEIDP